MVWSGRRRVRHRRARSPLASYPAPVALGHRADPGRPDDRGHAAPGQHDEATHDPGRARRVAAFPERHSCAQARAHRRGIVDESCHDVGSHAPGHPPRRRRHRPILGTAALGGPPGQFRGTPDAVRPPRVQGTRPAALAPGAPARAGRHDTHDSARGRNRVRLPALLRRRRRPARHRLARLRALPRTDGAPVAARTRPPCRDRR